MNNVLGATINSWIWSLTKGMVLVFLFLYLVFAFIVWRQTNLLNHVLGTKLSPVIKLVAVLHLIFALLVIILSFLTL